MRLVDLEPIFLRIPEPGARAIWLHVDSIEEAHGIRLLCPKCFVANGGAIGTHSVVLWRPEAPLEARAAGCSVWPMEGTGFSDLTLTPSIQLLRHCGWHGYITKGEVITL